VPKYLAFQNHSVWVIFYVLGQYSLHRCVFVAAILAILGYLYNLYLHKCVI